MPSPEPCTLIHARKAQRNLQRLLTLIRGSSGWGCVL